MPFGGYDDFDDCVARNRDKDDPEAYCGKIKADTGMAGDVVDLDERRRTRRFHAAEAMSRHPSAHRPTRTFRKPQNPSC